MARASRLLGGLAAVLAIYLAVLLVRYFLGAGIPRFRIETMFMWFLAAGVGAVLLRPGPQTRPAGSAEEPFTAFQYFVLGWFLVLVAFVLYRSALRIGFLSDDYVLADWASRREWVHAAETGFVRPIVPMFWAFLSAVPLRFEVTLHAVNILLHALNGLLIVAIGVKAGFPRVEAAAAGLLFLMFPALTEAVAWVSGMQDVLMTTFALAALAATLALGTGPQSARVRTAGSPNTDAMMSVGAVAASAIALGVKETAVVIPALAWIVTWASPGGVKRGAQRVTLVAMSAVAAAYALFRAVSGLAGGYGDGFSRYFVKQLIVEPFASLGQPWSAAWMDAHPVVASVRALTILALLAAAFWSWRRDDAAFHRSLAFGSWTVIGVLPVFSFFHVSATLEGSRYLYLPAAGFVLFVAGMTGQLFARSRRMAAVSLGALLIVVGMPAASALQDELARWTAAAQLRDAVLSSFVELIPASQCESIAVEGLVDNINGAYVFRNGFELAVRPRARIVVGGDQQRYKCSVGWSGHLTVRQDP
jgi:hypothetical protein